MIEAYEDVAAFEAIDDLIDAIENTIDATETEPAIIATALSTLTAKWAGRHLTAKGREEFARAITKLMDIPREEGN